MFINLKKYFRPDEVIIPFEKFMKETGLADDFEFYKRLDNIKKDVDFFMEFIRRTPKVSGFSFEVRLHEPGLIFDGFLRLINNHFNYYDYTLLKEYIYVHEVLKRLFNNYWIDGLGINNETVSKVIEFHPVVEYYLDIEKPNAYVHHYIGGSYGIRLFNEELDKQLGAAFSAGNPCEAHK